MHLLNRNTSPLPVTPSSIDVSKTTSTNKFSSGDKYQRWNSLIGIFVAISGNILISFALNVQRYAHIKLHDNVKKRSLKNGPSDELTPIRSILHVRNSIQGDDGDSPIKKFLQSRSSTSYELSDHHHSPDATYLRSPYWWIGIFLMTLGEVGNFLAYGFAPASIVSPLGVVALISNCVIAPILLKEKFRIRDLWGVIVAITGAVTVVISANHQEQKLGPHEILKAMMRIEFEIYVATTISIIGILVWASPKYGSKIILIDLGIVGLVGGYTALSTKGISSMLSSTLWRTLTTPITYVLLIVLAGTAVMQVKYINKALQRYDSTQVIPVQFVTFTLSVIVGSAILYRDLEKTTPENAIKFICGCLLTFFGVWLIMSGRPSNDDNMNTALSSDSLLEEQINLHVVDENLGRISGNVSNGDGTDYDSIKSTHSSISSRANLNYQSQRLPRPRVFPHTPPKKIIRTSQNSTPSFGLSEESPLLSCNFDSSGQFIQDLHLPTQEFTSSPSIKQVSNSNFNRTVLPASSLLSSTTHPHPQSTRHLSPGCNPEKPVTSNKHTLSRLINGLLMPPLSSRLNKAPSDSIRHGANLSNCSKEKIFNRISLHRKTSKSIGATPRDLHDIALPNEIGEFTQKLGASYESEYKYFKTGSRSLSNNPSEILCQIKPNLDVNIYEGAGPSRSK